MARQNGVTLEQFRAQIEAEGGSYAAVREQVRQEMILSRVQQGNVRNRVQFFGKPVSENSLHILVSLRHPQHAQIVAGFDKDVLSSRQSYTVRA